MAEQPDPSGTNADTRPFRRMLVGARALCAVGVALLGVAVWGAYARGPVGVGEAIALWIVAVATVGFEGGVLWATARAAATEDRLLRARDLNDAAEYLRGCADAIASARLWLRFTKRPATVAVWARLLLAWAPEGLTPDERLVLEALRSAVARAGDDTAEAAGIRDALGEVERALRETAALRATAQADG